MTRTAIRKLITDSTASMRVFMRTVYRFLSVRGVKAEKRIDWERKDYQLVYYVGDDASRYESYVFSFGMVKCITKPEPGAMYVSRENYLGFTFTIVVSFGSAAALMLGYKTPRRVQFYTVLPRVQIALYV